MHAIVQLRYSQAETKPLITPTYGHVLYSIDTASISIELKLGLSHKFDFRPRFWPAHKLRAAANMLHKLYTSQASYRPSREHAEVILNEAADVRVQLDMQSVREQIC